MLNGVRVCQICGAVLYFLYQFNGDMNEFINEDIAACTLTKNCMKHALLWNWITCNQIRPQDLKR